MPQKIDELYWELSLRSRDLRKTLDQVDKELDELKKKGGAAENAVKRLGQSGEEAAGRMQKLRDGISRANKAFDSGVRWAGMMALKVGALAFAFKTAVDRGGEYLNVSRSFVRVAGDQTEALNKMRAATSGLLSDYELMVNFNRAVTLGSAETVEEFSNLAETALTLGRALGIDAAFALESLNVGIGRQSRMVLDNLGLIISVGEANREYAEALDKTVEELTEAEKREAFRTAALTAAEQKVQDLGGVTLNAADATQQFWAQLKNVKDELLAMMAQSDRVEAFFSGLSIWLRQARGEAVGVQEEMKALLASARNFDLETDSGRRANELFLTGSDRAGGVRADVGQLYRDAVRQAAELQAKIAMAENGIVDAGMGATGGNVENLKEELEQAEAAAAVYLDTLNKISGRIREVRGWQPGAGGTGGGGDGTGLPAAPGEIDMTAAHEAARASIAATNRELERRASVLWTVNEYQRLNLGTQRARIREINEEVAALAGLEEFEPTLEGIAEVEAERQRLASSAIEADREKAEKLGELLDQAVSSERAFRDLRNAESQYINVMDDANATAEEKRAAMRALIDAYMGLTAATDENTESSEDNADAAETSARKLAMAGRGMLEIANAAGVLDDGLRDALRSAIDLADAIDSIETDGLTISSGLGLVGAGIGIVRGIAAAFDDSEANEARRKEIAAMVDLEKALRELEDAILSDATAAERDAARTFGETMLPTMQTLDDIVNQASKVGDFGWEDFLDDFTPEQISQFQSMEDLTGIEFIDVESGKFNLESFKAAIEALQDLDIGVFGTDLAGRIEAFNFLMAQAPSVFEDAEDAFRQFLDVVGGVEGGGSFADAVRDALEAGGPEQVDQLLQSLAERLAAGDQSLFAEGGIFAGLTAREARELLEESNGLLADILEGTVGEDGEGPDGQSFTRNVQITEARAGRLLAMTATMVTRQEQLVDLATERNRMLAMLAGIDTEGVAPGGEMVVSVNASVQVTGTVATKSDAQAVGSEIGRSAVETMDRELRHRNLRSKRVQGRS